MARAISPTPQHGSYPKNNPDMTSTLLAAKNKILQDPEDGFTAKRSRCQPVTPSWRHAPAPCRSTKPLDCSLSAKPGDPASWNRAPTSNTLLALSNESPSSPHGALPIKAKSQRAQPPTSQKHPSQPSIWHLKAPSAASHLQDQ